MVRILANEAGKALGEYCGGIYSIGGLGLNTELSDSRPAVITPLTPDNPSESPKPATLELQSGAAVRSSDLVRRHG
jgi:hypothetical protein